MVGDRLSSTNAELESRLRVLEDREAIYRLQLAYRRHLDERDFAAYAALFAPDGEWRGPLGTARGPAAIESFLDQTLERFPEDKRTYHLISNVEIDVDGDRATASSTQCYVVRGKDDEPVVGHIGGYEDILVRVGGEWRFQLRVASYDIPFQARVGSDA